MAELETLKSQIIDLEQQNSNLGKKNQDFKFQIEILGTKSETLNKNIDTLQTEKKE